MRNGFFFLVLFFSERKVFGEFHHPGGRIVQFGRHPEEAREINEVLVQFDLKSAGYFTRYDQFFASFFSTRLSP